MMIPNITWVWYCEHPFAVLHSRHVFRHHAPRTESPCPDWRPSHVHELCNNEDHPVCYWEGFMEGAGGGGGVGTPLGRLRLGYVAGMPEYDTALGNPEGGLYPFFWPGGVVHPTPLGPTTPTPIPEPTTWLMVVIGFVAIVAYQADKRRKARL